MLRGGCLWGRGWWSVALSPQHQSGDTGLIVTPELGLGSPAAGLGGGPIYTNAENLEHVSGRSTCIGGGLSSGFGGAAASVCGSVNSAREFNGTRTVQVSGEVTARFPGPSGSITRGHTFVTHVDPVGPIPELVGGPLGPVSAWRELVTALVVRGRGIHRPVLGADASQGNLQSGVATLVGGEHVGDPSPSTPGFSSGFEVLAPGAMVASNPLGQCRVRRRRGGASRFARLDMQGSSAPRRA